MEYYSAINRKANLTLLPEDNTKQSRPVAESPGHLCVSPLLAVKSQRQKGGAGAGRSGGCGAATAGDRVFSFVQRGVEEVLGGAGDTSSASC